MIRSCLTLVHLLLSSFVLSKPAAHPGLSIITTSIGGANPHLLQNQADYNRKVSVSVGSILNQQEAAANAAKYYTNPRARSPVGTRSVPHNDDATALRLPQNVGARAQPSTSVSSFYPKPQMVDIGGYGEKITSVAISYLQPDLSQVTLAKLRVILGADYDDAWMSADPRPTGTDASGYPPTATSKRLQEQLETLNFTILEDVSGTGRKQAVSLGERETNVLKRWLLHRATCPVQYVWRDTGDRYWPRWIRHAVCKESAVCSWPPGMQCKPNGSKTLTRLRWYCTKQTAEQIQHRAHRNYLRRARSLYSPGTSIYPQYPTQAVEAKRRFTREERRSKRVKRLVRKLSRSFREYYCEWHRDTYTLQPECSCMC